MDIDMDETLGEILSSRDYALSLSPGFFRFYAHTGVLHGLHQAGALRATHLSGSSAGAMVAGFYAAGLTPSQMVDAILQVKRSDIWDMGGLGGLLRGGMFHALLDHHLPEKRFEDCRIPCGVTAFDCLRLRTTHISDGCIATGIRASCTFPGLFQPVIVNSTPHIDGGVFDDIGLMALPGIPESNLIVNVIFEGSNYDYSKLPTQFHGAQLLTIIVKDIPSVSPFSMSDVGPVALSAAVKSTLYALQAVRPTKVADNHWVATIAAPPADFYPGKSLKSTATFKSTLKGSSSKKIKKKETPKTRRKSTPEIGVNLNAVDTPARKRRAAKTVSEAKRSLSSDASGGLRRSKRLRS